MKKRIICLVLTIILFVTIFPITAFAAAGDVPTLTTSESGFEMIKRCEGFSQRAYLDGSQWTIGYGVACDPADYPDGITREEAEELLRKKMLEFEDTLNRYLVKNGLTLTQNQFDALASITFNLGGSWINPAYRFWGMMRDGIEKYTDNEIASAIGVWCHIGSTISTGLIQRRATEIRVFLYNDYTGASGNAFHYLIFNGNGGTIDTDVMLYRKGARYAALTTAERAGYLFAGWYTAKTGGTKITADDIADKSRTLYARWSVPPPPPVTPPETPPSGTNFSDVPATQWYSTFVTDLSSAGVISGFRDGTFRPQEKVTVGQALKLVLLSAGYDAQAPTSTHWASGYQALTLDHALLTAADVKSLDTPATRALVAKLAANALQLDGSAAQSVFADTTDSYVNALQEAGIVDGRVDASGKRLFYPASHITRAEIAKIVWNVRENS